MTAPKHNPLLKGLYILSVLIMFTFMTLLVKTYWPDSEEHYGNHEYHKSESSYESPEIYSKGVGSVEGSKHIKYSNTQQKTSSITADYKLESQLTIVGLKRQLYLNNNVTGQIGDIWSEFEESELWNIIPDIHNVHEIHMVYDSWNFKKNSVNIILGYSSKFKPKIGAGLTIKHIPEGWFIKTGGVLDSWQDTSNTALLYQNDYEVYTLNQKFDVTNQSAFLRVR